MHQISTTVAGLVLEPLTADDAGPYHELLHRNLGHLGSDYDAELALREADHAACFADNPQPPLIFGVRLHGVLVGRVDLAAVEPPKYGLGYWLTQEVTGRGYAIAAVQAVTAHARNGVAATDIFAEVSHGNVRSAAVLERVGFVVAVAVAVDFEDYTRFHLPLADRT